MRNNIQMLIAGENEGNPEVNPTASTHVEVTVNLNFI